jgi:hypothetical protein
MSSHHLVFRDAYNNCWSFYRMKINEESHTWSLLVTYTREKLQFSLEERRFEANTADKRVFYLADKLNYCSLAIIPGNKSWFCQLFDKIKTFRPDLYK